MSAPWDLYVALAYRPKLGYRSPEPPPSPPNYALTGFIFNVDEPVERLRRRLENPSVDFCAVPSGKTETVINTLILLFRTLNYYVHFKDMTEYMSSVAHDLCWDVADCRDIVRRYVRAREAFTSVRTRNQSHLARHRSHDSDRVRLLCDLVDEYISSKPVYRATPESRHDFFDQTRALWKDMLKEASILDPMRIIEPPDASMAGDDDMKMEDVEQDNPCPGNLATELVVIADHMKQARTLAQNLDLKRWPQFEKEIAAFVDHVQSDEKEAHRLVKQMDSVLDREQF
ncbi:hypothetical protein NKR19_g4934 [Coniochaeta hoffmannii]|uniref:Uncharacterized protein n=1 Tax=Coniochaeta hoffmannii TaxID=91930 RepID=A0AA38S0H7_9PEZI|nr:hypothetical protein NKR19_g4934 [Coniochaeta hoffmannii]